MQLSDSELDSARRAAEDYILEQQAKAQGAEAVLSFFRSLDTDPRSVDPEEAERPLSVVERIEVDTSPEPDPLDDTVSFGPEGDHLPGSDGLSVAEMPTSDADRLEEMAVQATDPPYHTAPGVDLSDDGPASLAAQQRRQAIEAHESHALSGTAAPDCEFCQA